MQQLHSFHDSNTMLHINNNPMGSYSLKATFTSTKLQFNIALSWFCSTVTTHIMQTMTYLTESGTTHYSEIPITRIPHRGIHLKTVYKPAVHNGARLV